MLLECFMFINAKRFEQQVSAQPFRLSTDPVSNVAALASGRRSGHRLKKGSYRTGSGSDRIQALNILVEGLPAKLLIAG
jgi:hypothetical protein